MAGSLEAVPTVSARGPKRRKLMPPREKQEQEFIRSMYEAAGFAVMTTSQPQRAKMTAGWPDLLAIDLRTQCSFFWHEVKRRQGPEFRKMSHGVTDDQKAFHDLLRWAGHEVIAGGREAAEDKLYALGRLL